MKDSKNTTPSHIDGYATWAFSALDCEILFVGKGPQRNRLDAFREIVPAPVPTLSWPRQIHSDRVIEARQEGLCGDGDAIRTDRPGAALSVVTADCVPIVILGSRSLATVHAGWRGLVAGLIPRTLADLGEAPESLRAWIGPAIGACCYEVGVEVADQVVAASAPEVQQFRNPRPHLDLARAAAVQLTAGGVTNHQTLSVCTRCSPQWLWSYRRDGAAAGRNWTFAWRR